MFNLFLVASILLFGITVIASILYYRQMRKLRDKYQEASGAVGDIVVSFESELREYENKLEAISQKTDLLSSRNEKVEDRIQKHNRWLKKTTSRIDTFSEVEMRVSKEIQDFSKRIEDVVRTQKKIADKITKVEKRKKSILAARKEERVGIETPIPIKREKALAPLTQTELRVLKILADGSQKTAPEIKEAIELTREHTARLMKKLYEEGYLERSVRKIPYTYRIKKEMLKILKDQA